MHVLRASNIRATFLAEGLVRSVQRS